MQLLSPKPSSISSSSEYISFRSRVSQKKIVVDDDSAKVWTIYDAGPRNVSSPLICLPPVSGTADVFFNQIIALSAKGYRVIAIQYPVYWTIKDWVTGFSRLLDYLGIEKVHLFGASLGGFLAQKFAEYTHHTRTVHSLILCNSFTDTSIFNYTDTAVLFWIFPAVVLKRMIMGNFSRGYVEPYIADSIDFMVEKLDSLSQPELASRLTLTCMNCYVQPQKLHEIPITIIDVFDESSLSPSAREELYKFYPDAKRAHLKRGGNFPYLSVSDEVNLHIQIHLRPFENTKYSACDGPVISQPSETAPSYYDPFINQQNEKASVSNEPVISHQNEKASVAGESVFSHQNEKASVIDESVFSYQNEKASTSNETVISPQNFKENDKDS